MTETTPSRNVVYRVVPDYGGPLDFDLSWINAPNDAYSYRGVGPPYPADMPGPIIDFTRILAQRAAPLRTPFQECYEVGDRWLVSDAVWGTLQALDPEGFVAVPAELRVRERVVAPPYWLATLTRFVDCFDARRSQDNGVRISDNGSPDIDITTVSVFDARAVGNAHFFRVPGVEFLYLCTEGSRARLLAAGLTRFWFEAVGTLV